MYFSSFSSWPDSYWCVNGSRDIHSINVKMSNVEGKIPFVSILTISALSSKIGFTSVSQEVLMVMNLASDATVQIRGGKIPILNICGVFFLAAQNPDT